MRKKIAFVIAVALLLTAIPGFITPDVRKADAAVTFQRVNFVNGVVTATALNVRTGPSTNYKVVCVLKKGQTVKIFGKLGDWYAIYEPATGCVGAVSSKYIKVSSGGGTTTTPKQPTTPPKQTPTPQQPPATTTPTTPPSGITEDEQTLLNLVNKARADAGVGPLAFDMELVKVARLKAQDMVQNNYFSHTSPTYGDPFAMMRQFGITFKTAGENIAGNQTVEGAFKAWMNSEGHRKNILNGNFNYTGIGIVSSKTYGKILVQMFIGK